MLLAHLRPGPTQWSGLGGGTGALALEIAAVDACARFHTLERDPEGDRLAAAQRRRVCDRESPYSGRPGPTILHLAATHPDRVLLKWGRRFRRASNVGLGAPFSLAAGS